MSDEITRPITSESGVSPSYPTPHHGRSSTSVGTDESQRLSNGGNAIRNTINFATNLSGKEWVVFIVMIIVAVMLGIDISERGHYAEKIVEADKAYAEKIADADKKYAERVANDDKELSRMQAVERNHHDDAKDELKVAEMLAIKLEQKCNQ